MSQQQVKEMFLIPKETFFNCMETSNATQKDRMNDVNVEQLNVSCGPLFAGLKSANLSKSPDETTKMHSSEKKSTDDTHDSTSLQLHKDQDSQSKDVKKEAHSKPKIIMPEKNPIIKVGALTGKLMDTPSADLAKTLVKPFTPHDSQEEKKLANKSLQTTPNKKKEKEKEKKSASASKPQGAEESIMQRILGNLRGDKSPTKRTTSNSDPAENDFVPVDLELKQNFKSDFARSLSEKEKTHPEIRLNSTRISDSGENRANTLGSEQTVGGEDDVFLAETQEINPQGAESLVERALEKNAGSKKLGRLFTADFSRDDKPAEEQVNWSIEKTLATKNQQEKGEIERSRKSTANPIKVADLAGRFEKKQSRSSHLDIPHDSTSKKKRSMSAKAFYREEEKKSPPRARTRSEKAKEAHNKRKEKIAMGVDLPLFDSPKRVRYVGQM